MVVPRLGHRLVSRLRSLLGQRWKRMAESATESPSGLAEKRAADSTDSDSAPKKIKLEESTGSANTGSVAAEGGGKQKKIPKRKVAILLSYSGKDYNGMQRNKGVRTIEEDLLSALVAIEAVPQNHADIPQKMQFQRCARTDKGVSAVRQIVSLKMALIENAAEKINEKLPAVIRVIGIKRVTGGFNAKNACSHRTYSYMLPTFSFASGEQHMRENYRITDDVHDQVQNLLNCYKGTHNFHNFTSGKAFNEQSAFRFMKELQLSKAFVRNGVEFVVITIVGQSFMIHQIRKMIGLVIAITKGVAPRDTLDRCWGDSKMDIPKAPSLGLMLENVHFDQYNKRYGNDGMHEALLWEDMENIIISFKEDQIYPTIVETEIKEKSMMKWLTSLPLHTYDVRNSYQVPQGLVQLAAKKTEEQESLDRTYPCWFKMEAHDGREEEKPKQEMTTGKDNGEMKKENTNTPPLGDNAETREVGNNKQTEEVTVTTATDGNETKAATRTKTVTENVVMEKNNCQTNDQKTESNISNSDEMTDTAL